MHYESIFHDESSNITLVLLIYVIFIYWTTKLKKFDQIEYKTAYIWNWRGHYEIWVISLIPVIIISILVV